MATTATRTRWRGAFYPPSLKRSNKELVFINSLSQWWFPREIESVRLGENCRDQSEGEQCWKSRRWEDPGFETSLCKDWAEVPQDCHKLRRIETKFSGGRSGHAAGWGVSPPGLSRPRASVLVDHFTTIALEPTLPKETKTQQNPRQCQFISRDRTVILVAFSWDYGTEQGPHPSSGTTEQISFVHLMCRLYQ